MAWMVSYVVFKLQCAPRDAGRKFERPINADATLRTRLFPKVTRVMHDAPSMFE